jgi:hypothetical protein
LVLKKETVEKNRDASKFMSLRKDLFSFLFSSLASLLFMDRANFRDIALSEKTNRQLRDLNRCETFSRTSLPKRSSQTKRPLRLSGSVNILAAITRFAVAVLRGGRGFCAQPAETPRL